MGIMSSTDNKESRIEEKVLDGDVLQEEASKLNKKVCDFLNKLQGKKPRSPSISLSVWLALALEDVQIITEHGSDDDMTILIQFLNHFNITNMRLIQKRNTMEKMR